MLVVRRQLARKELQHVLSLRAYKTVLAYYAEADDDGATSTVPVFYHSQALDFNKATERLREHVLSVLSQHNLVAVDYDLELISRFFANTNLITCRRLEPSDVGIVLRMYEQQQVLVGKCSACKYDVKTALEAIRPMCQTRALQQLFTKVMSNSIFAESKLPINQFRVIILDTARHICVNSLPLPEQLVRMTPLE